MWIVIFKPAEPQAIRNFRLSYTICYSFPTKNFPVLCLSPLRNDESFQSCCLLMNLTSFDRSWFPQEASVLWWLKDWEKNLACICCGFQVLDMTEAEIEHLARHLGHDPKTHKDFYRLTDSTVQLSKVWLQALDFLHLLCIIFIWQFYCRYP